MMYKPKNLVLAETAVIYLYNLCAVICLIIDEVHASYTLIIHLDITVACGFSVWRTKLYFENIFQQQLRKEITIWT